MFNIFDRHFQFLKQTPCLF